jgi:hypothetical protein
VVVETNQNNADHYKMGSVYGGRGLGRYTRIDMEYKCVIICKAACDGINEAIGVDIHWFIFDAQAWYPMLLRNFFIKVISYCSDKI